jgi:cytochrome c-type protein NapC/trimethylamine-N-oxide reductase cytochrome c-type subunit TorC
MLKYFRLSLLRNILLAARKWALAFLAGLIFAILCFVGINFAMEPVSKSEYCGTKCHEMDMAYQSWKLSVHGINEKGLRSECHIIVKAYEGGRDLYKHHFGKEYNVEEVRQKVLSHISNKICLSCHVDLLAKPSSDFAKEAHTESLRSPDEPDSRCMECHEDVGHQR